MVSRVYIESRISNHPRALAVLSRMPKAPVVEIEHLGEVFNPKAQNFRLQKKNPALILAQKDRGQVLSAPEGYGLEGDHHYYFSHMLNCIYDCRYCFLQGMYRSAHQVLFVNFEDFGDEIERIANRHGNETTWFYSGYDCDSLANEPMTGFCDYFLPRLQSLPNAWLELRTKSTQVRNLLKRDALSRVVVAFSFSDQHSHRQLEHGVPPIGKRLDAMAKLVGAGWRIGLRLDPVVYHSRYQQEFDQLLQTIFSRIDADSLHSVSLGGFRLTRDHFRRISRLYPEEPLFAQSLQLNNGIISYPIEREQEMIDYCESRLMQYIPTRIYQPCQWHD